MPSTIDYSTDGLRDAVRKHLEDDTDLGNLLTGGIFDASELPQNGMSVEKVPRNANGVDALPFAVIRFGEEPRFGPFPIGASRGDIEVYVYQNRGYDVIDQAISRINALLDDVHILTADTNLAHTYRSMPSGDLTDEELGNLPLKFIRFTLTRA